ncbi:MAG: hypothetical protein A2X12_07785 [Bacteroidetes bacterium GWE2_29_8]|nr:MAG: hypothetical protein A2X12_07785 [Bacteroidetes bacterium GWE2_29_8]OFY20368.1 MAG: hypothetical protein A2X02_08940 [Bacteroidetes bacterium GWF2_29_10]
MEKIIYKIIINSLKLLSYLPFSILYVKAKFLFFIAFYVIRYRRKVVFENLRNSFPDKTDKEILLIAKKFYQNLADLIIEFLKIYSITKSDLEKRVHIKNIELLDELYAKDKNIMGIIGHCGNWEWGMIYLNMISKYKVLGAVKPLSNKYFEEYFHSLRTKFSPPDAIIHFKYMLRNLVKLKGTKTMCILAGDQTPTKNEINYWTTFLNQDTPVFLGTEKMSQALDYAVIFVDIQRIKRGYYEIEFHLIAENPKETKEFEITEQHVRFLEKLIKQHPDNWLWSHRRWKHKRESN